MEAYRTTITGMDARPKTDRSDAPRRAGPFGFRAPAMSPDPPAQSLTGPAGSGCSGGPAPAAAPLPARELSPGCAEPVLPGRARPGTARTDVRLLVSSP